MQIDDDIVRFHIRSNSLQVSIFNLEHQMKRLISYSIWEESIFLYERWDNVFKVFDELFIFKNWKWLVELYFFFVNIKWIWLVKNETQYTYIIILIFWFIISQFYMYIFGL